MVGVPPDLGGLDQEPGDAEVPSMSRAWGCGWVGVA